MYKDFYGFRERPFKLLPNPAYLFLSKTHEEALAHLSYAVSHGEGFVEITGEVGTGKTTLCRAFLESLDESILSAYIFNPKLDAIQLLKTINDELCISSVADTAKELTDTLNSFLIEKRAEGKNTVLVIDEAQNLSKDVLEQLRLLSNLETSHEKLLQIVLVGQPELNKMLNLRDLRQLRQRITLSCRLNPLTFKETKGYIRHRIRTASISHEIEFTMGAVRSIYEYAKGIPRLINISCDRALLTAFCMDQKRITKKVVRRAIDELKDRNRIRAFNIQMQSRTVWIGFTLVVVLSLFIFHPYGLIDINAIFQNSRTQPEPAHPVEPFEAKKSSHRSITAESFSNKTAPKAKGPDPAVHSVGQTLEKYLRNTETRLSRRMAFHKAMALWDIKNGATAYLENMEDDHDYFRLASIQNGFMLYRLETDLNMVKNLNLPAILLCETPLDQAPAYITLCRIIDKEVTLKGSGSDITAPADDLLLYWTGVAYIPWKDFFSLKGTIPRNSSGDSIVTLKLLLRDFGFSDIEINSIYDNKTREAIKKIQQKHGIGIDGVVGSLTKIALYNEKKSLNIPHIRP